MSQEMVDVLIYERYSADSRAAFTRVVTFSGQLEQKGTDDKNSMNNLVVGT
jgi:hypothetical protein